MSETTNEDRMYPIEMTLQGARCCISIGKGVIKALGKPSHVSIKISDSHDSLSVFPCDEDDVMAFRVPLKLFTDPTAVSDYGAMFAMCVLSLVPVIVLFLLTQRYIVDGIATSGLKG